MTNQVDWLRWGLEEIVRCTEPRAGSGNTFIFGIAEEALKNAGFPPTAAGIQKPTVHAPVHPTHDAEGVKADE